MKLPPRSLLRVHEYEYITPESMDTHHTKGIGQEDFALLRQLILESEETNGSILQDEDATDPRDLMRLCSPRSIGGEAIQAQNYVGVIDLPDGLQIEVLPKIELRAASDPERREREIFLRMLSCLNDIEFKMRRNSRIASEHVPLFEVFIAMFLQNVSDLSRRGLRSSYVSVNDDPGFVRGRIDFVLAARRGPAKAARLPIAYDDLSLDRPENRLIKSTLVLLRRTSRDFDNVRLAGQLLQILDPVRESVNIDADLDSCVIDRSMQGYETVLGWCKLFLKGQGLTSFAGETSASAILFPMEKVFESYVARMLKEHSFKEECIKRVTPQAHGRYLFNKGVLPLRPDIVVDRTDGTCVVLDTKWKMISIGDRPSREDLYQMYAYGKKYANEGLEEDGYQHVLLLYPWHDGVQRGLSKEMRYRSDDQVQVDVFFVELGEIDKSMNELIDFLVHEE